MDFSYGSIIHFLKPHSLRKNLLLGFIVIFLVGCIYLAASWGKTHVSVIQPRQLMKMWAEKKHQFSEKEWHASLNIMHSAIEANSNNTRHYFDLARLYEWSAYQQPIWSEDAIKHRTKAIQNYEKSLEYRPTWSSAWINLALSKTLNLEFGDEVKKALSNAMKYGVWEKDVFHKVLWISLANWEGLPLSIQEQVKTLIKITINMGNVPDYVQQTVTHFQWQDNLEEIINTK